MIMQLQLLIQALITLFKLRDLLPEYQHINEYQHNTLHRTLKENIFTFVASNVIDYELWIL